MNKIYKVIWSKAKHTYVVASEIAKGHTKGETTGKGLKKLAAAMLVAAALLSPSFAWAEDTATVTDTGNISAASASVTNSISVGHNANVGGAVNAGSLNSRGNLNVNGNALVKGTLTSQSTINGKEIVSQTNITAKNKVVGMQGVVDNTLTSGNYVTAGNTVGKNIVALDTQVKANADQFTTDKTSTALHVSKGGNLIVGTKENQIVKNMKINGQLTSGSISTGDIISGGDVTVTGKMAADGVTDDTTKDGTYIKHNNTVGKNLGSLDTQVKANADAVSKLDTRITNVKEYVLSETNKNYVSKTDAAVQDGAIVKAANTIGENVTNLDAALAKETAARIGADKAQDAVIQQVNQNAANGIATLATAYNNEVASREAADTAINNKLAQDKTDTALHVTKDGNLIVGTKENQTVKDVKIRGQLTSGSVSTGNITATGDAKVAGKVEAEAVYDDTTKPGNYVVQTNSVGSNLSVLDTQVKANADAVATKANAADVYTKTETDSKVDAVKKEATIYTYRKVAAEEAARKAADNELNERITNEANAIHETTNQLQSDLSEEAKTRESKDNELNERITNEANAIHDEIKAGDTALDNRITAVKESLQQEAADTYVSKADAAVQDGAIVKADKTIGENVTNLDAALAKETADRLGADKAQDKVIQQVNQNMVDGFNTINKNMADGFTALNNADLKEAQERAAADTVLDDKITAETSARVAADTKLVEAVNSGVSLSDDNVLQKNTTTIDAQGNVTTSKTDAKEMILNKGKDNQITLNEKGIKVGTNSTVVDKDGVYTGGDTFDAAKAAMSSDGQIKGANGKFTVDASGNTTVTSLDAGTGTIQTKGDLYAKDATFSGDITAKDATLSGDLSAKDGTFSGDLSAKDGTFSGDVSAKDVTATGTLQGAEVTDGTATMQNGNITGVKNLSAETITTSGNADIGGDLTVKGKLNVDEIDLTKSGIVGDNNVTASTKVAAGEITGYKKATSTKDGSEKESAIDYDENGTSTWAKATDADGNWKKSTLTVEGNDVTSKMIDSDKNSNISTQTASESNSTITGTADGKNYKSYITQNLKNILQGIKEGTNESFVDQTETGIKSTAADGKNTASTNLSNKGFNTYATDGTNKTYTLQTAESLTSQIGDDGKVKSVMNADGITNNADGGTITNSAKDLVNTATGNMTNTVGGKLLNDVTGDMENKVGGNLTTTVSGTSTETVTGKKTENYNGGLETTVTGEEKHTVNGSQTNAITGDQTNTIGGSQTTTVTGDSSLKAENITNEAKNKITNKAIDVETDATSSIVQKVTNDYGSNTSTQLSYQTTEEMSQADGKTASYLRGAAEEKSQLIDGAKKTTIDTIAGQTNTNITDGTNTSNDLQKADQIASSVTDGTNTTVVNQDAKSLASSITDGTKANNTNSTVDKSEQLIKASDTQYSATSKTATKMEDALVSGGSVIDVIKNLDDAANPFIGSAVTDGTNSTGSTMTAKGITNSAAESIVNEIGDGSAVKSEMTANGITNTAKDGTITNDAKDLVNTASENMTNNVGKDLTTTVGGEMKTTVTGKVTEDYKSDLDTKVGGNETHYVKGNQTNTVSGNRTVNVKGTETENFNALETNVKTDQKTSVGGNQTNIVGGDQQNTVSGSKTETVKGSVTEKYGSQATTVDGDQSTNIGGNQTTVVAKDQTNTVSGNKTETVKGAVNETYGSQTTKVNGDQSTTVTGKQTNSITGDQVNTIGGNQTTTVTGDSSLSAKNITNTASEKITNQIGDGSAVKSEMTADGITNTAEGGTIYNKSKDILNEVSGDILNFADGEIGNSANKITNLTGDNTVTSDTNGTTFENKAHNTAVKEGTVTKTTISGNTITTGEAVMDYADVMKDLGVRGNAAVDGNTTLGKEGAETTLTVNSTSTFNKDVTMKENATVKKNLTVDGATNLKGDAIIGTDANNTLTVNSKSTFNNGVTVTNGTTTDTLKVTGSSEFDGKATFNDIVTMNKGLSVTGGVTADTVTADSYKVGDKTYIDKDGINANNQVIRNVGQGDISAGSTDAVSGGQLYETNTRVSGLETRMGTVETRVDKLDNKIDKVGANAAAMANLHPLEFDEDSKWNVAAAVGSSGSETASAVGVFYRPNENVMVNASAAMGTGENMFGGGVSLRLGHGGNKAKEAQMKAAAAENKELRAKVDDLTARMDALLSVLNPNMSKDFPDVPENHWAYEAVSRLAGNGIVEGYEDGKYHGERQMTRYEMAEIIYNALSKGAKAEKKLVEEFRPELQAMAAQKKA